MALTQRRWAIVWCLFLSTVINYVNRQTLSVLAPVISKEFALSHTQLSQIFGAFQISYAGTWLLGGVFLDLVGTRIGLSIAVVWWSAVSLSTGFVRSASMLGTSRFLLGIGEGTQLAVREQGRGRVFPTSGKKRRSGHF